MYQILAEKNHPNTMVVTLAEAMKVIEGNSAPS